MIEFRVNGTPKPWANNEIEWRKKIKDECIKLPKIKGKVKLRVKIIFYLKKERLNKSDLDNLAKPVLDTICKVNNPQTKDKSLTGNIYDYDDNMVFELILKKEESEIEGAFIHIEEIKD